MNIFRHRDTHLEVVLDEAVTHAESLTPGTEEYTDVCKQIEVLSRAVTTLSGPRDARINTLLSGAVSLLGIAGILTYEYTGHVVTTKAFSHIWKPKQT